LTPASTFELRTALESELTAFFARPVRIAELRRSASAYRSSFALEDLVVVLEDGAQLALVFKDLDPKALSDEGRRAKPGFLHNPRRELEAYRLILPARPLEAATLYGAVVEPRQGRYWLFLQKVPGVELYQCGFDTWRELARWLARFHDAYADDDALQARLKEALRYDGNYYHTWLRRAQSFLAEAALPVATRQAFARLAGGYDEVVARLLALPYTVIHGEFFASNVLAQETERGPRFCPIDWEMAALAPGLVDLAALVSGSWREEEKLELAMAYYEATTAQSVMPGWPASAEAFLAALDCCRLHLAIQWLGWSNDWSPPAEHAQDWLAEALWLAERLEL
jgi:hypothetical protein